MTRYCTYVLICLLTLPVNVVFAHEDFSITTDFGNVKVRIKTSFRTEDINKVHILGQLAEKLVTQMDYKEPIFLDFMHNYAGFCKPGYFIAFDKGAAGYPFGDDYIQEPVLQKEGVVIRQAARQFDAPTTLKLLEYALANLIEIQSDQKQIEYDKNHCKWKVQTIDTLKINKVLQAPLSPTVKAVLETKVERPDPYFTSGISYYWQNGRYTLFIRGFNNASKELITLDDIYALKMFGNHSMLVFDTDSSFYYATMFGEGHVSNRQRIENPFDYYEPATIEKIGAKKLIIHFSFYETIDEPQYKERTLLYLVDKDMLIQDLDQLVEQQE